MKRILATFSLLAAALLLLGMGDLGGAPAGSVPQTAENLHAVVIDRSGIRTDLSQFSMDGTLFLEGNRGSGKLTVDFKKIAAVDFGQVSGDRVAVSLQLKDGEKIDLMILRRALFYGDTGYGAFKIAARDLQRIEFL
jgi:hypothetical protein